MDLSKARIPLQQQQQQQQKKKTKKKKKKNKQTTNFLCMSDSLLILYVL